ncbi:MAG: PHP domain-containing protein [Dethiobacter sp.]|nr:PHP domain-containing protein [Dethiobacter sp.]
MYQVLGNIHVHSNYSDGNSTIPEIARAAKAAGLAYVIITDHNSLEGLPEEGFIDDVLVLVGSEINNAKHHYLALGITAEIPPNDSDPQQVIDAVNRQNGLGFIAHPYEIGSPLVFNNQHFCWSKWEISGFTGMEVWNWCSQWRDGVRNLLQGLYYAYLNPYGPISGPCPQSLARFDQISAQRRLVAIAGSDAHAWPIRRGIIRRTIFPYEFLFRTVNNCLLLESPLSGKLTEAKQQVYEALRFGRSFIVNCRAGNPAGVIFTASDGQREYAIGQVVPFTDNASLQINCPHEFSGRLRHRIIHNGKLLDEIPGCNVSIKVTQPGTYRLEVYIHKKPWIFTNPIYFQTSSTQGGD